MFELNTTSNDSGMDIIRKDDQVLIYMVLALHYRSRIILIHLYTITTILAILGNSLVIFVFLLGKNSRTDLRIYLINLAVADLIMAIFCMPFTFTMTMLSTWIFSAPMCPVVLYMQTLSVTASVGTNMAIGIDRYMVVVHSLRSRITKVKPRSVLALIWVTSVILSSVQLVVGRANPTQLANNINVTDCTEIWPEPSFVWRRGYTFFILIITYVLPLAILASTYSVIGWKLWKRTVPGNADKSRDAQQLLSKRKVIKMLLVIVALFAICWLPLHVFILVVDFNPEITDYKTDFQKEFVIAFYYVVHWLAMSNSFVNPIIYSFFNENFKNDLSRIYLKVCCCCCCCFCCYGFDSRRSHSSLTTSTRKIHSGISRRRTAPEFII